MRFIITLPFYYLYGRPFLFTGKKVEARGDIHGIMVCRGALILTNFIIC